MSLKNYSDTIGNRTRDLVCMYVYIYIYTIVYTYMYTDVCVCVCVCARARARLLGASAKLRKSTSIFVTSVCPSVRIEQLDSHWTDFREHF